MLIEQYKLLSMIRGVANRHTCYLIGYMMEYDSCNAAEK